MNILLLAAGKGQRFQDQGYHAKPLIEVNGVPMWKAVLENFTKYFNTSGCYTYVATKKEYNIKSDKYQIVNLEGEQLGAAHSALQVTTKMNPDLPLLIMNCDQFIKMTITTARNLSNHLCAPNAQDGAVLHFTEYEEQTKWGRSIIQNGRIREIVEKTPVSDFAHTGHYFWKKTAKFNSYAKLMMSKNIKVNGEFFISPIFNMMIDDGKIITPFFVDEFQGIGDPEDLRKYLSGL